MRKHFYGTASYLVINLLGMVLFAACATPNSATQTPSEVVSQVCPILTTVSAELASPIILMTPGAKAQADIAAPIIATVCADASKADVLSLQSLQQQAIPALVQLAEASAISQTAKDNIVLAQVIIGAVVSAQVGGTTTAK